LKKLNEYEQWIFLIRHPNTIQSGYKRLIGQTDLLIDYDQLPIVKAYATQLAEFPIDHVFSSQLHRSRDAAEIVAGKVGAPFISMSELNEINLGDWDGKSVQSIKAEDPAGYAQRGNDMIEFRPTNGENFRDLRQRVLTAWRKISLLEGNSVIIGHASVNRILLAQIMDIKLDKIFAIEQDFNCINVIVKENGKWIVLETNGKRFPEID
jgi:broad specificity phosphatase PhoE